MSDSVWLTQAEAWDGCWAAATHAYYKDHLRGWPKETAMVVMRDGLVYQAWFSAGGKVSVTITIYGPTNKPAEVYFWKFVRGNNEKLRLIGGTFNV
jgi:hypothetical protein